MRAPSILLTSTLLLVFIPSVSIGDKIHRAARKGDIERVQLLINENVPVDVLDGSGQSPLIIASKFGHLSLVGYLLSQGADLSLVALAPDGTQGQALHSAVLWGHLGVVKTLLEAGADPDFNDPTMGTPLHIALARGHKEIANFIKGQGTTIRIAEPISHMIATADIEQGRILAGACKYCHLLDAKPDGEDHLGPSLWNIVGRTIASEDFEYSHALSESEGNWDYEKLNSFIKDPRGFKPGTKMDEKGIKEDNIRAALIAYLRTLSYDPIPLPEQ